MHGLQTADEAARWLRIGKTTLYTLVRRGEIKSVKIGTARRFPTAASRNTSNASVKSRRYDSRTSH